ncbi:SDR family NAD(P)-dependent oxidoreductase [Mycobacterium sp. AZCC_0083]|uniref:SDR family NAD(P)-dependent oxidoreductase n=1 Tax=Mycobacterium sp. AZCC_0083 TaxID=2735882 RepID=UPI00160C3644|nr:SDR family NAD(P)-dependent oxidoreductase [Mycobacterium sp. AZCC_0083]MBB5167726.1 NAD(P)-dependent dehydrogenase (short-subunit alcohol dehydrogenase family) [Mycobacterium sp. AZCC_0083]
MARWTFDDIPCQAGRTALATGANSGLGFESARQLALKGANVIAACRHHDRGLEAVRRIRDESPNASIASASLDLADLDSVARFADDFLAGHRRLDLLINNGGVLTPPEGKTKQGFELQFGTNHLGHFALTGRLLIARRRRHRTGSAGPDFGARAGRRGGRATVRRQRAAHRRELRLRRLTRLTCVGQHEVGARRS